MITRLVDDDHVGSVDEPPDQLLTLRGVQLDLGDPQARKRVHPPRA